MSSSGIKRAPPDAWLCIYTIPAILTPTGSPGVNMLYVEQLSSEL